MKLLSRKIDDVRRALLWRDDRSDQSRLFPLPSGEMTRESIILFLRRMLGEIENRKTPAGPEIKPAEYSLWTDPTQPAAEYRVAIEAWRHRDSPETWHDMNRARIAYYSSRA
jgi:hypothetical protein